MFLFYVCVCVYLIFYTYSICSLYIFLFKTSKIHFLSQNDREQDSPAALPTPEPTQQAASCQSVAVETLQEEITALRAEISSLQAQLAHFKSQTGNQRQQTAGSDSPRRELRVSNFLEFVFYKIRTQFSVNRVIINFLPLYIYIYII